MKIGLLLLISTAIAVPAAGQNKYETKRPTGCSADIVKETIGLLEAEGLIRQEQIDPAKTWTVQLAYEKLGKRRSHRICLVEILQRNGEKVEAIARREGGPIPEKSGTIVYVVSRVLQTDGKAVPAH